LELTPKVIQNQKSSSNGEKKRVTVHTALHKFIEPFGDTVYSVRSIPERYGRRSSSVNSESRLLFRFVVS
jgi:hypothetical protein